MGPQEEPASLCRVGREVRVRSSAWKCPTAEKGSLFIYFIIYLFLN